MQELDINILLWIQNHLRLEEFTPFWKAITFLGDSGWFWIVSGVVLICFKKTRPVGVAALLSLLVGFLITNVFLKNAIARPRPFDVSSEIVPLIKKPGDYSFPSGHTCASFSAALVYYRMLPRKYGVLAVILASLVALSRLYLGVHYPSDILGGFLVAVVGSWVVYRIVYDRLPNC